MSLVLLTASLGYSQSPTHIQTDKFPPAGEGTNRGKMDFARMNAAFAQFFGTKEQLNKPACSAIQMVALAAQGALVEIDAMAAKPARQG